MAIESRSCWKAPTLALSDLFSFFCRFFTAWSVLKKETSLSFSQLQQQIISYDQTKNVTKTIVVFCILNISFTDFRHSFSLNPVLVSHWMWVIKKLHLCTDYISNITAKARPLWGIKPRKESLRSLYRHCLEKRWADCYNHIWEKDYEQK